MPNNSITFLLHILIWSCDLLLNLLRWFKKEPTTIQVESKIKKVGGVFENGHF
jgi:hypothetical protein